MKQLHVLVFGLDVLGNPFGVIRGLAQGVESFFYEPYKVIPYPIKFSATIDFSRVQLKVLWNSLKELSQVFEH